MNNTRTVLASLFIAVCILGVSASVSFAQTTPAVAGDVAITYPIKDLGSCKNKEACRLYCDKAENMSACVSFAEKKGMLKGEDLRISKLVAEKVSAKQTPGGCTTEGTCEAYCNGNVEHLNECLSFGEQLGVIPAKELAEAKKIVSALQKGASMPGSCKTKDDCETYCAVGSHIDECLNFAEASGILPADELAQARKVAPFLKSGETPGKCSTKTDCDKYCSVDANFTECLGFAQKAGFVSAEDAALALKTGGKGPGNCRGQEQCAEYCNNQSHASECLSFAKEKGLLTAEEQKMAETGMDELKAGIAQLPDEIRPEVMSCLENAVGGKDKLDRLLSKQDMPTKAMGENIGGCFQRMSQTIQDTMMAKYKQGAGGSAPSIGDVMKNVPANVPADMRANIEKNMKAELQNQIPAGVPGASAPGGAPDASAPAGDICVTFASAPSCDVVPAGKVREMCVACKSR